MTQIELVTLLKQIMSELGDVAEIKIWHKAEKQVKSAIHANDFWMAIYTIRKENLEQKGNK
jgi:enamine deaminase RidA (YjgF/YER057c/UK114 family)